MLQRAFGARLLKTEMELFFWPSAGSMTDYSIALDDGVTTTCVGVSVTRALAAPGARFDVAAADRLLRKKLTGVLRSTETCCGAWQKQILHVWAPTADAASALEAAYARLDEPTLTADTVVLITLCVGLRAVFEEKATPPALARQPRALKGTKDAAHVQVLQESDPLRQNSRAAV